MKKTTGELFGFLFILFGAALIFACTGHANERVPGEEIGALSFSITGNVEFDDPGTKESGRVSLNETSLLAPLFFTETANIEIGAGVFANWTHFRFSKHPDLDTEDLYGIALPLMLASEMDCGLTWNILFMPGIYSDFKADHAKGAKYLFHATTEYPVMPKLKLSLGLAYDTAFGEERLYPTGGIIWRTTDKLAMHLVLPAPVVYWTHSEDLGIFLMAAPGGDFWKIYDKDDDKLTFETETWRTGAGIEHRLYSNFWLRATGGMDFSRKYEFRHDNNTSLQADAEDTWFASLAVVMY